MAQDSKSYINRAKELEIALYTQRRLMDLYNESADRNTPAAPELEKITAPKKPVSPQKPKPYSANVKNLLFWFSGVFIMGLLAIVCPNDILIFNLIPIVHIITALIVVFIFGSVLMVLDEIKLKEQYKLARKQYVIDYSKYSVQYDKYIVEYEKYLKYNQQAQKRHDKELEKYKKNLTDYNENRNQITKKCRDLLLSLSSALQEHYSQNLLAPRYRNLIAVTSICDYLQSGRAENIEQACNLYQDELRQNKIIGFMPQIIKNPERIKNNQPTLYQEIKKTNCTLYEIFGDNANSKSDAKLLAYLNGISSILK